MRSVMVVLATLALFTVTTGCGSEPGSPRTTDARTDREGKRATIRTVRAFARDVCTFSTYNYLPLRSPDALRKRVDLVATGTVQAVRSGRTFEAPYGVWQIVLTVTVDRVIKGHADDGRVYIEIQRPRGVPIARAQRKLREGTRAMVFARDRTEVPDDSYLPVAHQGAGRPAGTRLYHPHPQGMFFAAGNELVGCHESVARARDMAQWDGAPSLDALAKAAAP